ncbi:glucosaminidase domain-containing protein [Tenacibaculum sp. MEBiC06402]|uniref:glucosaminidase domain-containing protein n=1 Tax=unclassified Tenacibaculum TaxID=2635139 RepID=UPI003B9B7B57
MKLRVVFFIVLGIVLTGCGSKKQVVSKPTQKPIIVTAPKKESKIEIPEIEHKKTVKKTKASVTATTKEYIEKFAPIAVREMHRYKIPASITLAQGILESGSGRSPLAIRSNNHFGIKCHKGWEGKSVTHDDDEIGECFRKYQHPETSYEDHSQFLITRKRYARLFKLNTTDYKGWAYGLKRAGYATDKKYPNKLIGLIKKYNLDKYDRSSKPEKEAKSYNQETTKTNFYYKVIKGDTLYSIARKFNTTVSNLKKINGLRGNTISVGQELILK